MTFHDFELKIVTAPWYMIYPQRMGQFLFNELHKVRPDLADEIWSTGLDTFHRDDRIGALWTWLEENW